MTEPTPPAQIRPSAAEDPTAQNPTEQNTSPRSQAWVLVTVVVLGVLALALTARPAGGIDQGVGTGFANSFRPPAAILSVLILVGIASSYAKRRDDGYRVLHRGRNACGVLLGLAAVAVPAGLLTLGRPTAVPPTDYDPTPQHPRNTPG